MLLHVFRALRLSGVAVLFLIATGFANTCLAQQTFDFDEWLMIGPIPTIGMAAEPGDEEAQEFFFNSNQVDPMWLKDVQEGQVMPIGQARIMWQKVLAEDGAVDIAEHYGGAKAAEVNDYAAAFLYKVINAEDVGAIALGIGSDDAVRVWVNGDLVHDKWTARPLQAKDDFLPISLRKGENRILAKVQNRGGEWGFSCHQFSEEEITRRMLGAIGRGDIDEAQLIHKSGHDVNANIEGVTPLHIATIRGMTQAKSWLESVGAKETPMPRPGVFARLYFDEVVAETDPGVSWLVFQGRADNAAGTSGLADVEAGRRVTPTTVFRIGSVSKQFTAVAILKLMEEGKLRLDSKLSDFVPDFPRGDEVTIAHMLGHTSGIFNYTDDPEFSNRMTQYISMDSMIADIKKMGYSFDPGESWAYCNSGYMLLGHIIEKVSGKSLAAYWDEIIFEPLDMTRSGVYDNANPPEGEAIGYSWNGKAYELSENWDMTWAGGAGNIYSTPADLMKWNQGLWSGLVIKRETLELAHKPTLLNNGEEAEAFGGAYGYGWLLNDYRGVKVIDHGGGLHGFHSHLAYYPEHRLTIVVLKNSLPGHAYSSASAAQALSEFWLHENMEAAPEHGGEIQLDPGILSDYVGSYEYPGGAILKVVQKDDELHARVSFQQEMQIFSSGVDTFFWKIVEATVIFNRDDAGKVVSVQHLQNGQDFIAPRMEPRKSISLPQESLEKFEGIYLMRGMEIEVKATEGQLSVTPKGQGAMKLYPSSETEFFLDEMVGGMNFILDDQGEVLHAIMIQGAMELQADKKVEAED